MNDMTSRRLPARIGASRTRRRLQMGAACILVGLAAGLAPVVAEEIAAAGVAQPAEPRKVRVIGPDGTPAPIPAVPQSDVERYCTAIADPAKDARVALQTQRLQELEAELGAKIDALEAKRREYQSWLEQRQAFLDSTNSVMIDIYAAMKPDAAASQLSGLDREVAASVITKLKSRTASAILAEMPAQVASELASLIVRKTNKDADAATADPRQGSKS